MILGQDDFILFLHAIIKLEKNKTVVVTDGDWTQCNSAISFSLKCVRRGQLEYHNYIIQGRNFSSHSRGAYTRQNNETKESKLIPETHDSKNAR